MAKTEPRTKEDKIEVARPALPGEAERPRSPTLRRGRKCCSTPASAERSRSRGSCWRRWCGRASWKLGGGKIDARAPARTGRLRKTTATSARCRSIRTAGREIVAVNWSESPLGQLMRRKGRDGEAFLSSAEFQAGERLRADYTRGQIMPRLGRELGRERLVGTARRRHRRPDGCRPCGAGPRGECDPRGRPGTVGHPDRRLLLPERHGDGRDGTRLAGAVGEDRAEDSARRAQPPLQSGQRTRATAAADAALGRGRLRPSIA